MTARSPTARVLLVSALQVYPTRSGGHLRTFGLASSLARQGAEVFVYSFVGRKGDYLARQASGTQVWPSGIQEYVNRSALGFLAGYGSFWLNLPPLWLTAFLYAACKLRLTALLPRLLRDKLAWCDAVIADFPFVFPILDAKAAQRTARILNLHNVEHHLFDPSQGWRSRLIRAGVRKAELAAAGTADVVVSCSEGDRRYFEDNVAIRRSLLVPNGIDLGRFQFSAEIRAATRAKLEIADDTQLLLFTASKWGPNQEAFDFLLEFAKTHEAQLVAHKIHFLIVGNVVDAPVRLPALTATGKVDLVEPYFAAADAAINPLVAGAGTNVKMGEFIAARLPILVSSFGARGYRIEQGRSGFVFERQNLLPVLIEFRQLFDTDPARLRRMSDEAFAENVHSIDMDQCVLPLLEVLRDQRRGSGQATGLPLDLRNERNY